MRGYAVTRDPLFLQPYDAIVAQVPADRAALRAAAVAQGDTGAEQSAAATMTEVMGRLAGLRSMVSAGAAPPALTAALVSEKSVMDAFRAQIADLVLEPGRGHRGREPSVTLDPHRARPPPRHRGRTRPPDRTCPAAGVGTMSPSVLYIDDDQGNILLVQRLLRRTRPDIRLHDASTGRGRSIKQ